MLTKWFSIGLLALVPSLSTAAGDPAAGKELAAPCGACHGQNGIANLPGAPNIAGQNERYMKLQLDLIKSNVRPVPQMMPIVQNMTPADFENLAAYYSKMPAPVGQAQGDQVALGEKSIEAASRRRASRPVRLAMHQVVPATRRQDSHTSGVNAPIM